MKLALLALLSLVLPAQTIPIALVGRPVTFLAPSVDAAGKIVVFGSAITPSGTIANTTDLYVSGTDGTGLRRIKQFPVSASAPAGATAVSLSSDGAKAAYTLYPAASGFGPEEIHVVGVSTGADVTAAIYSKGCIQPLCVGCSSPCVHAPHISPDGGKVLYQVSNSPTFYLANADGSGVASLPVYTGSLAPAPARVIANNGLVVFTSSAPFGPTFAASATDVYIMNLDGTNIRAVTHYGSNSTIFAQNATISADGSTLAFELGSPPQIWVVSADGSNLRQLGGGTNPSLSSNGAMLTSVQDGRVIESPTFGLGPVRLLVSLQMSSAQDAVLSDSGARVVFDIGPKSGGIGAIYSAAADGSGIAPIYAPHALNAPVASAPGALLSVYGFNLTGDSLTVAPKLPLPQTLAGVSLLVNGSPVPLDAATPWQLNAQIPPDVPAGKTSFQLQFADGGKADAATAQVNGAAPAVFSYPVRNFWQATVLHAGTAVPVDDANPATAGEALEIYGTGLGATVPAVSAGAASPLPPATTVATPQVMIGNKVAAVLFSGLTPGFAGLYQVNVTVPAGLPRGRTSVIWSAGSATSDSIGTITIK